jgi:hypothetical protein
LFLRSTPYVVYPETGEQQQEQLPDSTPYENTDKKWSFLVEESKYARSMGLVNPRLIIDKRTPRPFLNAPTEPAPEPSIYTEEPELDMPAIEVSALEPHLSYASALPRWNSYTYDAALEPNLVELWVEKSLDDVENPIIERLCEELNVNLVTGLGFMTISSIYALLDRRAALDKPLRVLYLSDFDPAGEHMPVGPARHIEFAIRHMDPKPDIKLCHLALTEEQVIEHQLPRIPIKESDRRKASFEKRRRVGAVELNAIMSETRAEDFEEIIRSAILDLREGISAQSSNTQAGMRG